MRPPAIVKSVPTRDEGVLRAFAPACSDFRWRTRKRLAYGVRDAVAYMFSQATVTSVKSVNRHRRARRERVLQATASLDGQFFGSSSSSTV